MGVDLSFAKSASYDTPDSAPWSPGVTTDRPVTAYGGSAEDGFYDSRDDMVGGSDTEWTPNWASEGDTAPVVNSGSGLGGGRAAFSGVLSQESLAG